MKLKEISDKEMKLNKNYNFFNFSRQKPPKKYSFIFVCQKGEIEIQSLLLVASLKLFLKVNHELIAAIPGPKDFFRKPDDITLHFMKRMGVKLYYFENDFVKEGKKSNHYLIANKIFALKANIDSDSEKIIFLDSDILCIKNFYNSPAFILPFNAILAGPASKISADFDLKKCYEFLGLKIPNIRINNKNLQDLYFPPYFSSGFIGINPEFSDQLSSIWLDFFRRIDYSNFLTNPYFTDELTLGIAIQKMNIPFNILNDSLSKKEFFHYCEPKMIAFKKDFRLLVRSFILYHPEIKELISRDNKWSGLF